MSKLDLVAILAELPDGEIRGIKGVGPKTLEAIRAAKDEEALAEAAGKHMSDLRKLIASKAEKQSAEDEEGATGTVTHCIVCGKELTPEQIEAGMRFCESCWDSGKYCRGCGVELSAEAQEKGHKWCPKCHRASLTKGGSRSKGRRDKSRRKGRRKESRGKVRERAVNALATVGDILNNIGQRTDVDLSEVDELFNRACDAVEVCNLGLDTQKGRERAEAEAGDRLPKLKALYERAAEHLGRKPYTIKVEGTELGIGDYLYEVVLARANYLIADSVRGTLEGLIGSGKLNGEAVIGRREGQEGVVDYTFEMAIEDLQYALGKVKAIDRKKRALAAKELAEKIARAVERLEAKAEAEALLTEAMELARDLDLPDDAVVGYGLEDKKVVPVTYAAVREEIEKASRGRIRKTEWLLGAVRSLKTAADDLVAIEETAGIDGLGDTLSAQLADLAAEARKAFEAADYDKPASLLKKAKGLVGRVEVSCEVADLRRGSQAQSRQRKRRRYQSDDRLNPHGGTAERTQAKQDALGKARRAIAEREAAREEAAKERAAEEGRTYYKRSKDEQEEIDASLGTASGVSPEALKRHFGLD